MTAKKHPSRFNGSSPSRGLGGLVRDITALDQRALLILVTVPVVLTLLLTAGHDFDRLDLLFGSRPYPDLPSTGS